VGTVSSWLLAASLVGAQAADATVTPQLIAALRDGDIEVRHYTAMALARLGPAAIGPLSEALKDANHYTRAGAAYALAQIGPEAQSATGPLLTALKDSSTLVRRQAAYALSKIVQPQSTSPEPPSSLPPPVPAFPETPPK
jgi:HEAT repeat protein